MSDETVNNKEPKKLSEAENNAWAYMSIGFTFFILGITLSMYAFTGVSIVFFILGVTEYKKRPSEEPKLNLSKSDTEQGVDDNSDTQR